MDEKLDTIYNEMVANNVPVDHHESDLYVPVNEVTTKILSKYYPHRKFGIFISQLDGKSWFDIPFAYAPFWEKRSS